MILDVEKAFEISGICLMDIDFYRHYFNSLEAGYWIHPLMQAGVRLETVTEGPINWNDFSGRIVHAAHGDAAVS